MNINSIKCFSILAKTLNFTKASEQMYMSQSALSKMILRLENEIGCELFVRDKKSVILTRAGQTFLDSSEKLLIEYENALVQTRGVAGGKKSTLKVGFLPYSTGMILPATIESLSKDFPELNVKLYDGEEGYLVELLTNHTIDIALLTNYCINNLENVENEIIYEEDYRVVVPPSHHLYNAQSVDLSDLKDEKFIILNQKYPSAEIDISIDTIFSLIYSEFGFAPKINFHKATTFHGLQIMVRCGCGIALIATHAKAMAPLDLKFIPIRNKPLKFKALAIYEKGNDNIYVNKFNSLLKQKAKEYFDSM